MPILSDEERERIKEVEVLKSEIRSELQTPKDSAQSSKASAFFKHEAVLLCLGFILTTAGGSWMTYKWKQYESKNQQAYLAKQKALESKYALVNDFVKAVSATKASAEDVEASYSYEWNAKIVEARRSKWISSSYEWRVNSLIIRQKLAVTFDDPAILVTFDQLVKTRRRLGNAITRILTGKRSKNELDEILEDARKEIGEMDKLLKSLGDSMAIQIRKQ